MPVGAWPRRALSPGAVSRSPGCGTHQASSPDKQPTEAGKYVPKFGRFVAQKIRHLLLNGTLYTPGVEVYTARPILHYLVHLALCSASSAGVLIGREVCGFSLGAPECDPEWSRDRCVCARARTRGALCVSWCVSTRRIVGVRGKVGCESRAGGSSVQELRGCTPGGAARAPHRGRESRGALRRRSDRWPSLVGYLPSRARQQARRGEVTRGSAQTVRSCGKRRTSLAWMRLP